MNPTDFPPLPDFAAADELECQAGAIGSAGRSAAQTASDCRNLWLGLGGAYSAPEAGQALGAFDQVNVLGTEAGTVTNLIEDALNIFAGEARALKLRADNLVSASGQCLPPGDDEEDEAARATENARLAQEARAVAAEYAAAEARCAAAIRSAAGLVPDPGFLSTRSFGATTSMADTIMDSVHRSKVHVRSTVSVVGDLGAELRVENIPFDLVEGGQRYTRTASGLLIPAERALDLNRPPIPMDEFKRPPLQMRPASGALVTPPTWARNGGRALFVLDVGVKVWDAGSSQYNADLVEHPEWDGTKRALSVGENVAIVGGASVGGGIAGAAAGVKTGVLIGGWVGSVIPGAGTAAGAVVGGIVGGIVGGVVGSELGKKGGEKVKEIWDSFWDWP